MIYKSAEYKNGYVFAPSSTDSDLQDILSQYDKVNCVICNELTKRNFRVFGGTSILTINNKLADGVFFVNGTY